MLSMIMAFGMTVIGCKDNINSILDESTIYTFKYLVTGEVVESSSITSSISVGYRNSTMDAVHLSNITLPWEESFSVTISKSNPFFTATVIVSATFLECSLTAKIFVDGEEVSSESIDSDGSSYTSFSTSYSVRR